MPIKENTFITIKVMQTCGSLKATFPGKIVSIVPNSDFTKVIINTSSEKDPGTGYFYDVSKGKIEFIASYAPWLQDYDLAQLILLNLLQWTELS